MKFFTPGPSELLPTYRKYLDEAMDNNIGSISHRGSDFEEIMQNTILKLKQLMKIPQNYHVFFLSSANEAMERVVQNLVETKSIHLVEGKFGEKWYKFSKGYGKEAIALSSLDSIPESDLICVTHNETSNGLLLDLNEVYSKKNTLLAVDCTSSAPYVNLDFNYVDVALFSVQKGFGMPAGLGILVMSDECLQKAKELESKGVVVGPYHSFSAMDGKMKSSQTVETPNIMAIYILGKVCEEFISYGLDKIRNEIKEKADMLYNYFDSQDKFPLALKDRRSPYLLILEAPNNSGIINYMKDNDIVIGTGYGERKKDQLRIPNFFAHSKDDVEKLIKFFQKYQD